MGKIIVTSFPSEYGVNIIAQTCKNNSTAATSHLTRTIVWWGTIPFYLELLKMSHVPPPPPPLQYTNLVHWLNNATCCVMLMQHIPLCNTNWNCSTAAVTWFFKLSVSIPHCKWSKMALHPRLTNQHLLPSLVI